MHVLVQIGPNGYIFVRKNQIAANLLKIKIFCFDIFKMTFLNV